VGACVAQTHSTTEDIACGHSGFDTGGVTCPHSQKLRNIPLTLAHAHTILYKYRGHPIRKLARQSACEARPSTRHAPVAAYAAPVIEGAQEHAFCLREIIHLIHAGTILEGSSG